MLSLVRSKDKGGGAWTGLVTRDCPNVIVPTQAAPKAITPGTNWAWGNYTTITTGLAYEFLLRQIIAFSGIGENKTLDGNGHAYFLSSLIHIQLATYINQAYAAIAEAQMAESGYIAVPSGAGDVSLLITTGRSIPCYPVLVPSSTQISGRSSTDVAPSNISGLYYLSGYDTSDLSFDSVAELTKAFEQGQSSSYPLVKPLASTITITGNAASNTLGAYSAVIASLANDTLICGALAKQTVGAILAGSAQFDVSIGAAGSEVVQARYALPSVATYFTAGSVYFPFPFIGYAGERIAVRVSSTRASSPTYVVSLWGVEI